MVRFLREGGGGLGKNSVCVCVQDLQCYVGESRCERVFGVASHKE